MVPLQPSFVNFYHHDQFWRHRVDRQWSSYSELFWWLWCLFLPHVFHRSSSSSSSPIFIYKIIFFISPDDTLLGGRNMHFLPVTFSLVGELIKIISEPTFLRKTHIKHAFQPVSYRRSLFLVCLRRFTPRLSFETFVGLCFLREGVKKNGFNWDFSQTMGRWVQRWVQSPKLFSENNHSIIFTANIQKCPKTCNT